MRFTGAEEAGYPSSIARRVDIIVLIEEAKEVPLDLGCHHVLFELICQMLLATGLNDRIDGAIDRLCIHFLEFHCG